MWVSPLYLSALHLSDAKYIYMMTLKLNDDAIFFFLHSCFISDPIVFFVTLFGPIIVVFAFNFVIFILGVRVLVTQSRKKKISVKSTIKTMISIVGLMVIFGLTWLFGALTVREASTAFQYLFVIFNGFQGFFFFVAICLIGKDGREFWSYVITNSLRRKSKKSFTSSTSNPREKAYHNPIYTTEQLLSGSNLNKSEELKLDSPLQEKTECEMDTIIPNQQATSDKIYIKGSLPETLGLEEFGTGMESEMDLESELGNVMIAIANEDAVTEANIMRGGMNGGIKTDITHSELNGDEQTHVMHGEMNRDIQANALQDRVNKNNEVNVFEQEFEELNFTPSSEKGNENSIG